MRRAILTLKLPRGDNTLDLELPLNTKIDLLKELLIESLKNIDSFTPGNKVYNLFSEDRDKILTDDETLAENGLWEGSVISLV